MAVFSWLSAHGCSLMAVCSWLFSHGCLLMAVYLWRRSHLTATLNDRPPLHNRGAFGKTDARNASSGRALAQYFFDTPKRLPSSVLVLDQTETNIPFTVFSKPQAGRDRHTGFLE
jgi:hypothetical protein